MFALLQKLQAACVVAPALNEKVGSKRGGMDLPTMIIVAFGLLCVTVPLELSQLSFGLVGAFAYMAVQSTKQATRPKLQKRPSKAEKVKNFEVEVSEAGKSVHQRQFLVSRPPREKRDINMTGKQEVWKPSVQPVSAPSFTSNSFETQVVELLDQISPSAKGDEVVQRLAATAKRLLRGLFPEGEVGGFACGDVMRGSAFGVAIPEVDIILSAPPKVLADRLQNRVVRPWCYASKLDARTLQKSALRACTDDLVVAGGFKFRRSSFKADEPKVTLVAPVSMGLHTENIPISFSVNTVTPFYSVALLTECGQINPRAKQLILLVRRWVKDRGISHAAKGHLSPYLWTLVVVYFLQVRDSGPLLPALGAFKLSSSLFRRPHDLGAQSPNGPHVCSDGQKTSVAVLFKEFVSFYLHSFSWHTEAVSVRVGGRAAPDLAIKFHVVITEEGLTDVAPCIEDPFYPKQNLSSHMTAVAVDRLRQEIKRAEELFVRQTSLAEVLEPWTPEQTASIPDENSEL